MSELAPPSTNNWFVITGGPSSGKTSLVEGLAERGYHVVHEHARQRIDLAIHLGLAPDAIRANHEQFQRSVLDMQLEHESNTPPELLTFFDRGIPDTLAYRRFHHLPADDFTLRAVEQCSYRKVFLLELLPLVHDYCRNEDEHAQQAIQGLLEQVYAELPFPIQRVPVLPLYERLEHVLQHLWQ